MSYLNQAHNVWSDLLQYAQHIETITGEPTEGDFQALTSAISAVRDIVDNLVAYQSEVVHQKNQLVEAYPEAHMEWASLRPRD